MLPLVFKGHFIISHYEFKHVDCGPFSGIRVQIRFFLIETKTCLSCTLVGNTTTAYCRTDKEKPSSILFCSKISKTYRLKIKNTDVCVFSSLRVFSSVESGN